jgi:hypothetical protein
MHEPKNTNSFDPREVGPALAADERPWPLGWERDPQVAACPHEWETVLLAADGLHRTRTEEVVRCRDCHAPRCGHTVDPDPCDLVRHHDGPHFPVSAHPPMRPFEEDPIAIRHGWTRWQKNQAARRA